CCSASLRHSGGSGTIWLAHPGTRSSAPGPGSGCLFWPCRCLSCTGGSLCWCGSRSEGSELRSATIRPHHPLQLTRPTTSVLAVHSSLHAGRADGFVRSTHTGGEGVDGQVESSTDA